MIIDAAVYRHGERQPCADLSDELERVREEGHGWIWIGLKDPTDAEFDLVKDELQLHPLAVEDAVDGHQRPKLEIYDASLFVVVKPLRYIDGHQRHRDRRGHGVPRRPVRRHRPAG